MKTKYFIITLLTAILLPMGAKAADTVDFTADNGIMYKIRIENNEALAAVVTGFDSSGYGTPGQLKPLGTVSLTIPAEISNSSGSVTVPVIGIAAEAFKNQTLFKSVTIAYSITSIGTSAFEGCSYLQTVTIYNSLENTSQLETIGASAFSGCRVLTGITLPLSVKTIGASAFKNCSYLKTVSLSTNVTSIGNNAFLYCGSADGSTDYVTMTIRKGTSSTVSASLFRLQDNVKSIVLNSGITTIGTSAFNGMSHLTNVSLPTSLRTIGENAFQSCGNLTSIIIPEGVTTIKQYAFSETPLVSVSLPSTLTTIGNHAFSNNGSLAEIDIPQSVTSIGDAAFDCQNLAMVNVNWWTPLQIPSGTDPFPQKAIEGHAVHVPFGTNNDYANDEYWGLFSSILTDDTYVADNGLVYGWAEDGTNLAVVSWTGWTSEVGVLVKSPLVIGDHTFTVTEIADNAFSECPYLNSITIPSSVTKIGEYAFVRSALALVEFEDNGLLEIGFNAFNGCAKLKSITIPTTVTTIDGGAFNNCTALETANVSCAITYLNNQVFQNCSNLTSVTLPSTLQGIAFCAFYNCSSLENITFPEALTEIGFKALGGCEALKDIYFSGQTPPSVVLEQGSNTQDLFEGGASHDQMTLHVPFGTKATYQEHSYWGTFSNIVYVTPEITDNQLIIYRLHAGDTEAENWAEVIGINEAVAPSVTSITISESVGYNNMSFPVTTIVANAFAKCTSLTTVTLPSTITAIGSLAFTSRLESVTIEATTPPSLADNGFSGATYTNAILYVPEGTTEVYGAASGWMNFYHIQAPIIVNGLVYTFINEGQAMQVIGYDGTLPQTLNIPESVTVNNRSYPVTTIAAGAFSGHSGIKKVNLPTSLTTIEANAFRNCTFLSNVTVPTTVQSIAVDAFFSCKDNLTMEIVAYDYNHSSVPESFLEGARGIYHVNLVGVTAIGNYAFKNCYDLESIIIPTTVRSIAVSAFDRTTSLTKVTAQWTSASEIVNNGTIFYDQYRTATLYVPTGTKALYLEAESWKDFSKIVDNIDFADDDVETICVANWDTDNDGGISSDEAAAVTNLNQVFKANTDIKKFQELRYFTGLTEIGVSDFEGCTSLEIVELPTSVTKILTRAFYGCSSLQGISGGYQFLIPVQVTSIGEEAFANCKPASRIQIFGPAVIGARAFAGSLINSSESQVSLTSALNSIATDAFDETDALFYINSSNDTPIGVWLFKDCTFLKNLSVNAPIEANAFMGCTNLESVFFSDDVTSIGAMAFQGCSKLQKVELPWTLQAVSSGAFGECTALKEVTINENVTSVERYAFSGCTSLETIIVKVTTPPASFEQSFDNSNYNNATLFVPEESAQAYASALPWSKFNKRGVVDSQGIRYTYAMVDGSPKATVVGYKGWADDLVIAGSIKGHDGQVYPVKEINTYPAFELAGNYFMSITIPASITTIQGWAFADNVNLKTVKVGWSDLGDLSITPHLFEHTLIYPDPRDSENTNGEGILYVPAGTTALYQSTAPWSYFKTFIEYQPGNANGDDDNTIDINDVLAIVDYILGKNVPATFNAAAADVNGDGRVTIADAAAVVNIILGTGN